MYIFPNHRRSIPGVVSGLDLDEGTGDPQIKHAR
jgi:hypothetical protein